MMKTFKYKLYPSRRTRNLDELRIIAGEVRNYCLQYMYDYHALHKTYPLKDDLQKIITQLKKLEKYNHWSILGSQAIQDVTDRIYRNLRAHYKRLNERKKSSLPSLRRPDKNRSITYKQAGYKLQEGNKIRLGSEVYRYFNSREIEGEIKTVTVKIDPLGDYYVYITCSLPTPDLKDILSGKSVGLDFGLKTFLTSNEGKTYISPYFLFWLMDQLREASKQHSSKKKGSKNRERARLKKARIHKKAKNARYDFFHKLAKELAQKYNVICIEDLCLKGMHKLWGRKISDIALSSFILILKHHCIKEGTTLIKIDRYYPSSQQCSECFVLNKNLSLRDRVWTCNVCHSTHDRDINAAKNIHRVGTSTLGRGDIRPTELAIAV